MPKNTPNSPEFYSPAGLDILQEEAAMPYDPQEEIMESSKIVQVKQAHEQQLLAIDGVTGVGIQRNAIGDESIVVYLLDASCQQKIPNQLEGFQVMTEVTGSIDAY